MNNIEEKVKIIAEVLNVHTDPLMDNLKHSTDATVEEICKCMDAYQPPQPSDEEIERMARLYVKTLPALNYRSAYEFGTQNITAWTKGFKSGLSYRSKEEILKFHKWLFDNQWYEMTANGDYCQTLMQGYTGEIPQKSVSELFDLFTTKQKEG